MPAVAVRPRGGSSGTLSSVRRRLAAVLVPVAVAAALGATLDVGGAPLLAFAVGLSITAAALLPAAAVGLGRDAGWLFGASPRSPASSAARSRSEAWARPRGRRRRCGRRHAVCPGDPSAYLELEGAAAFVLGCAAFGGAVVPWRADRLLQQLASYGSVIAVVVCGWLAVGRLEGAGGLDGTGVHADRGERRARARSRRRGSDRAVIAAHDRIALPPSVERRAERRVRPRSRRHAPAQRDGRGDRRRVDARSSLARASARYAVDEERALADAIGFCAELNERLLLNVSPRARRVRARSALGRAPAVHARCANAAATFRHVAVTSTRAHCGPIVVTGIRATLPFALATALGAFVVAALVLGGLGAASASATLALAAAVGGRRDPPRARPPRVAAWSAHVRGHARRADSGFCTDGSTRAAKRSSRPAGRRPRLRSLPCARTARSAGDRRRPGALLHALGFTVLTADGRTLCVRR